MSYRLSRSEKKRRAKNIEMLATELVALANTDIKKLPCDDFLKDEIISAKPLKGGARKRQIKYITKQLRELDNESLFAFLAQYKGSRLKQTKNFHQLERFRDDLIDEALQAQKEAWHNEEIAPEHWDSPTCVAILEQFPSSDINALQKSAMAFARTHKKTHSREVFRILKANAEQQEMLARG